MGSALQFPEGSWEVQLLGQRLEPGSEKCLVVRDGLSILPRWHVQHTLVDYSSTAGDWYCCMRGFFFTCFCPTKESPAARAAFTGRCLKVPVCVYCAGQLKQQKGFNRCKGVGLWSWEIMTWVLKKFMVVLDINKFKLFGLSWVTLWFSESLRDHSNHGNKLSLRYKSFLTPHTPKKKHSLLIMWQKEYEH